jgi:hypothetical protein
MMYKKKKLYRNTPCTLLEMVMESLTLMGNLSRTGCVIVSKAWKKKFRKCMGIYH